MGINGIGAGHKWPIAYDAKWDVAKWDIVKLSIVAIGGVGLGVFMMNYGLKSLNKKIAVEANRNDLSLKIAIVVLVILGVFSLFVTIPKDLGLLLILGGCYSLPRIIAEIVYPRE